jgi:hypothetical protein
MFKIILLYILPLVFVLIPLYLGEQYGKYRVKKNDKIKEGSVGAIVGATFGLLAFLLAFTFQIAESRYVARKELLLKESGEIRSMYHLAGLLPDSIKTQARAITREYVDIRLEAFANNEKKEHLLKRSQEIVDQLWYYAEYLNKLDRSSEAYSLYASAVINASETFHERKIVTLNYSIPPVILFILGIMTFISMILLGFQIGVSGRISFLLNLLLGLTFAVVIWLILVLDRPELGVAKINQQPLIDLQTEMNVKPQR